MTDEMGATDRRELCGGKRKIFECIGFYVGVGKSQKHTDLPEMGDERVGDRAPTEYHTEPHSTLFLKRLTCFESQHKFLSYQSRLNELPNP